MISLNQRIRAHKRSSSLHPQQRKAPTHHIARRTSTDTTDSSSISAPLIHSFDASGLVENCSTEGRSIEQAPATMQLLNRDLFARGTLRRRLCASLSRKVKEHHISVNAAFHLQHGSVTTDGRNPSIVYVERGFGRKDGEVEGFRSSLKVYHRDINGAYGVYYGAIAKRDVDGREMQWGQSKEEARIHKASVQGDGTGMQLGKRDGWEYEHLNS